MAKPQKSTAQSEVPGLVKKGPLYYLKRDWQLYALMLLPMVFIHHALLGPLPGSGPNFYAKQPLQGTVPAPTRQRPRKVYTIC